MTKAEELTTYVTDFFKQHGPGILLAIVTLLLGLLLIKYAVRLLKKRMEKRKVDPALRGFLASIANFLLYVLLFLSVAQMVGIGITSFVAIIGAAGLAIGLALQGSLANFAGGVLILLFKPFRLGEFISSTSDASGTVKEIDLLYTTLTTPANEVVFVPNGPLANSVITNYSRNGMRRMDLSIGIAYDADVKKAREVLLEMLNSDSRILKDPAAPTIMLGQLADSSVNLIARFWVSREDYWDVHFEKQEQVKEVLDANGISIPFPHREIIIKNENAPGAN